MALYTVAVDFDGTLVQEFDPSGRTPLSWRPGALDLIRGAAEADVALVVHSCRCALLQSFCAAPPEREAEAFVASGQEPDWAATHWRLRGEMLRFFRAEGVWGLFTLWESPGKPYADLYVDDKAEGPDLKRAAAALGIRTGVYSGDGQRRPEALGDGRQAVNLPAPAAT